MIALQAVGVPLNPEVRALSGAARGRQPERAVPQRCFAGSRPRCSAGTDPCAPCSPVLVVDLGQQGEKRMKQQGRQNPADDEGGMIAGLRVSGLCLLHLRCCASARHEPSVDAAPRCTAAAAGCLPLSQL